MGLGAVVAVMVVISAGLGGYVAVDTGYVPVKMLAGTALSSMHEVPPPGAYSEISVSDIQAKYPAITNKIATQMPHYNDILIKLYSTNATLDEVASYYNSFLNAKGFTCQMSGHMDVGNLDLGVLSVYYYGYEKGLTGTGVVLSDHVPGKTLVLYTTGYSSYYGDILPWLENQRVSTG